MRNGDQHMLSSALFSASHKIANLSVQWM